MWAQALGGGGVGRAVHVAYIRTSRWQGLFQTLTTLTVSEPYADDKTPCRFLRCERPVDWRLLAEGSDPQAGGSCDHFLQTYRPPRPTLCAQPNKASQGPRPWPFDAAARRVSIDRPKRCKQSSIAQRKLRGVASGGMLRCARSHGKASPSTPKLAYWGPLRTKTAMQAEVTSTNALENWEGHKTS